MNDVLTMVFLGHVDHGKSTLIARLLLDSGTFPDGRIEELRAASKKRGVPVEISFLLDALQVERDQAVTIDASRLWLTTPHRTFAIVDAPGHKEFVRHMVTGASEAGAAVLLVDAHEGVSEQTRRHLLLLSLLNVGRVVVVVNKMDLVDFAAERFEAICREVKSILGRLKIGILRGGSCGCT
ncbi:MAG: GTP-binding protein [Candidatus Eremiobacteraeota bacterium]|nr:GTP-binding protein [Candidatus Eremiobacteraeota bacterium]